MYQTEVRNKYTAKVIYKELSLTALITLSPAMLINPFTISELKDRGIVYYMHRTPNEMPASLVFSLVIGNIQQMWCKTTDEKRFTACSYDLFYVHLNSPTSQVR